MARGRFQTDMLPPKMAFEAANKALSGSQSPAGIIYTDAPDGRLRIRFLIKASGGARFIYTDNYMDEKGFDYNGTKEAHGGIFAGLEYVIGVK